MSDCPLDEGLIPEATLSDAEDVVAAALMQIQQLVIRHPIAAQAAFRALVCEGRRYGETERGAKLRASLADSALVRKGRVVWECVSMNSLEEHGDTLLPTQLLECFAQATGEAHLEPLLADLFEHASG